MGGNPHIFSYWQRGKKEKKENGRKGGRVGDRH